MIMPYINFNGNCEEAFTWYVEVFGGEIQYCVKFGDMPTHLTETLSDEQKKKVMHSEIKLTEIGGVSGADSLTPVETGGPIFIHAHLTDASLAKKIFSTLGDDGVIIADLATNPPPDDYSISGCVKDKYGVTWIISARII